MRVSAPEPIADFVFGVSVFNVAGVCCYGTNTDIEELRSDTMTGDGEVVFVVDSLDLVEGTYKVDVAVHSRGRPPVRLPPAVLYVPREVPYQGCRIYRPRHHWTFTPNILFRESTKP